MTEQIEVLDKGWIELRNTMGSDSEVVADARTSYLGESKGEWADRRLLTYLVRNGHWSPFDQSFMKIRVKMPIMVARQWMRHFSWSFNEQSYRYTEAQNDDFYLPEIGQWREQSDDNKQGSSGLVSEEYQDYLTLILKEQYQMDVDRYKHAIRCGAAREQARLFLPGFSLYTTLVATASVRSLFFFFKQRCDEHAQWEIRQYADALYKLFAIQFPWCAEAYKRYIEPDWRVMYESLTESHDKLQASYKELKASIEHS